MLTKALYGFVFRRGKKLVEYASQRYDKHELDNSFLKGGIQGKKTTFEANERLDHMRITEKHFS